MAMNEKAATSLAAPTGTYFPFSLTAWLRLAAAAVLLAIALPYAAAQLWMLDDHAIIELDLADDRMPRTRTIDLLRPGVDYIFHICCDDSTTVIDDVAGRPARRFIVRPTDPLVKGSHRAEIRLRPNGLGQAVWYRAAIHVPPDWQESPIRVTAMQWHGTRDVFLMEPGRTPPLQLEIVDERWEIVKSWDQRLRTPDQAEGDDALTVQGRQTIAEAPLTPGRWNEWTFYVLWSTGDDGEVRAWHNGELVVEDRGPNAHLDLIGPYMKAGVYVPDWTLKGPEPTIGERALSFGRMTLSGSDDPFGLR